MPNLWPFFSVSCFSGFADSKPDNFYAVYQGAFEEVWAAEPSERRDGGKFPPLGTADSPWRVARDFYSFWSSFTSVSNFAWADKWRTPDGESRDVRRQMKKENDKLRAQQKKAWQETVRKLAAFVKNLDRRVIAEQQRCNALAAAEKEARALKEKEKRAAKMAARLEVADEVEDAETLEAEKEFWNKLQESGDGKQEAMRLEEDNELACAVCNKEFRSKGQRDNHLNSKKHKEEVERWRHELSLQGEELPQELDLKPETIATPPSSSGKKKKKGKKKEKEEESEKKEEEEEDDDEGVVSESNANVSVAENVAAEESPVAASVVKEAAAAKGKKDKKPRRAKKNGGEAAAPAAAAVAPVDEDSEDDGKKKKSRRAAARKDKGNLSDSHRCLTCKAEFITRSGLFRHLEETNHAKPKP